MNVINITRYFVFSYKMNYIASKNRFVQLFGKTNLMHSSDKRRFKSRVEEEIQKHNDELKLAVQDLSSSHLKIHCDKSEYIAGMIHQIFNSSIQHSLLELIIGSIFFSI